MVKNQTKSSKKTTHETAHAIGYKGKILEYIKQKSSVSLAELEKLDIKRQTLRYNLRKMCRDKLIRPFIKMKLGVGFVLPEDDEIYFTYTNGFEYPQEVKQLIDQMCSEDVNTASQAFEVFVDLYKERDKIKHGYMRITEDGSVFGADSDEGKNSIEEEKIKTAKKVAYALMSGMIPRLKEKIAFELTTAINDEGIPALEEEIIYGLK